MEDFKQNNFVSFVFTVPENVFVLYENTIFWCSSDNPEYLRDLVFFPVLFLLIWSERRSVEQKVVGSSFWLLNS